MQRNEYDVIHGNVQENSIFGQEGNDILLGDGDETTLQDITNSLNLESSDPTVDSMTQAIQNLEGNPQSGNFKNFLDSVEGTSNDGNDQLFGGSGDDLLFGMGGDDYLNGGAGEDYLFGGSGNDIIVYDENDFMVSGGEGIDFMVTDKDLTMDDLLASGRNGNTGPIVDGIDVLIKGDDALSLTNMDQLASEYGISINQDGNLELDASMWEGANGTFTNDSAGLTLETTLTPQTSTQDENLEQQVIILQHSNS